MSTSKVPAKSRSPNLTGGSRKGVPNKVTADLKAMILGALDQAGGMAYLARSAESHPAAFLTLVGKVLPLQVTGAGGDDLSLKLTVEYVRPKPDSTS